MLCFHGRSLRAPASSLFPCRTAFWKSARFRKQARRDFSENKRRRSDRRRGTLPTRTKRGSLRTIAAHGNAKRNGNYNLNSADVPPRLFFIPIKQYIENVARTIAGHKINGRPISILSTSIRNSAAEKKRSMPPRPNSVARQSLRRVINDGARRVKKYLDARMRVSLVSVNFFIYNESL